MKEIKGIGIGEEIINGKARLISKEILRDIGDFNKIFEDDIIILENVQNNSFLLIMKAKGAIVKNGGILSHAAIVLREAGKTGIIGIGQEIANINNGDEVILNPIEGKVIVK